jgi:Leucine rich repeat
LWENLRIYRQLKVLFFHRESIDLSNNKIKNIDENAFSTLESLKLLDLSNNNMKRVHIRLPNSLEILTMAHNQLISWPLANTPEHLAELELQFNSLEYIFPKDSEVDSLRTLDVSNNLIDHLPNTQFFKLDKLDLSYNRLTSVPQNLNSMTPLLHELILDGNQISTVFFAEKTTLGSISLKNIESLETLGARAFSNLAGIKMSADGSSTCVDIHVSQNKNLRLIDENAFKGVSLCLLDLSWNQLTKIPMNLTDWSRIQEGIDLQGNPFECNCNDQWMLAEILNRLYANEMHQFLLSDLKCQSPEEMKDLRFIQFLYHDNPFCGPSTGKKLEKIVQQSSFSGLSFGSTKEDKEGKEVRFELTHGPGFIIIIAMCVLILIAMVLVGIRWQRDQNRKLAMRNRRYGDYDY